MFRLIAGALLTALVVAVVAAPAGPAAAETTVKVDGNVLRIVMTVDVVGTDEHPTGPDGTTPIIEHWQKILEDTWGAAFDQLPYRSCYKLALKVSLKARGADFDAKDGNHRIIVGAASGGSFEGTGFDGNSETSRNPKTGDGTRSFEHDRDGAIPVDAPPTVVAHEFGHLFGLGDDREGGAPKAGRDNTMMVGGVPGVDVNVVQTIDQDLVDRLGDVIKKHLANQGTRVPECVSWKGPIEGTVSGGESCTGTENGTVTLAVVRDAVAGSIDSAGSYTCLGITIPTSGVFRVVGTLEDRTFELNVGSTTGTVLITPTCAVGGSFEIPVERGKGSTTLSSTAPSGDVYTCNLTIERQSDREPVG